jgi:ribosomal-protein-alanine N-acetyltransferase
MNTERPLEILTSSLVLRPIDEADVVDVRHIWNAPDVRRFLFDDQCVSPERVALMLAASRAGFESRTFGIWVARVRGDDAPIGTGGFWPFHDPDVAEIFWALVPEHWGRGLATEMSRALIRWGFDELGLPCIRASMDAPNVASLAVAERLGMRRERPKEGDGPIRYRLDPPKPGSEHD